MNTNPNIIPQILIILKEIAAVVNICDRLDPFKCLYSEVTRITHVSKYEPIFITIDNIKSAKRDLLSFLINNNVGASIETITKIVYNELGEFNTLPSFTYPFVSNTRTSFIKL